MSIFDPPDISKMKEKKDLKGLIKAQENKDPNIVRDASFALSDLGVVAYKGLFIGISSQDWQIRAKAYACLADSRYDGNIALLASLHDPHEMVRMTGLLGLLVRKENRAIQPIGECLLYDPSKNVRESAVQALFKLCGEQGMEYFFAARSDPDPDVKKGVDEVLTKLGY